MATVSRADHTPVHVYTVLTDWIVLASKLNSKIISVHYHDNRRTMAKEVGRQHVNAICSLALLFPAAVRRTVVAVRALRRTGCKQ